MTELYDVVVIGAGFYGLYLSERLARYFPRVLVCEREVDALQRASYHNQARVHNGYHYPRSILTAVRSRVNFPRFVEEFRPAIHSNFEQIYAIAGRGSKTSADQFQQVMKRIGAPLQPAAKSISRLFNPQLVEAVFRTTEHAFNAVVLKSIMLDRVRRCGVELRFQTWVTGVEAGQCDRVHAHLQGPDGNATIQARHVFCCGYAQLNQPTAQSISPLPLKHELTEMALVEVPGELREVGVTIMDGPFFSCMPFPPLQLHTLSHVRFTPHGQWYDRGAEYRSAYDVFADLPKTTAFPHMARDAARYLPILSDCRYRGSLWEVKTVLPRSEIDDSRPILFRPHHGGLRNYHLVMGGKIDNVYDVWDVIAQQFGWTAT